MPEAEIRREISVGIPASQPPITPIASNVCIVNRVGMTVVLDFGFLDPRLLVSPPQEGTVLAADHVARVAMAEDIAMKLRDQLNRLLGAP